MAYASLCLPPLPSFCLQVTDLTLAREQHSTFSQYLSDLPEEKQPRIDLTVTVLTTGFWPSYKSSDLALPSEMVRLRAGTLEGVCSHQSVHWTATPLRAWA